MSDEQLKIMAAAVYEIRCLLSGHLGSTCDSDPDVRLAAHLSYALHNQSLEVIEGDGTFDPIVISSLVSVLCLGISAGMIWSGGGIVQWGALPSLAIVCGAALFTIRGYAVSPGRSGSLEAELGAIELHRKDGLRRVAIETFGHDDAGRGASASIRRLGRTARLGGMSVDLENPGVCGPAAPARTRSRQPWTAEAGRPDRRWSDSESGSADRLAREGPAVARQVRRRSI